MTLLFLCPWLRRWHRHGARSIVGEETHPQVCSSDTRSTLNTLCVLKSKFWPKEEWKSTLVTFSSSAHTSERREPGHHVAPNAAKQSYFFMAISIIVLWQTLIILLLLYISRVTFSLHYQHWLLLAAIALCCTVLLTQVKQLEQTEGTVSGCIKTSLYQSRKTLTSSVKSGVLEITFLVGGCYDSYSPWCLFSVYCVCHRKMGQSNFLLIIWSFAYLSQTYWLQLYHT